MATSYAAVRSAASAASQSVAGGRVARELRRDCAKCGQPQSAFLGTHVSAKAVPSKAAGRPTKAAVRADTASTIPKEVRDAAIVTGSVNALVALLHGWKHSLSKYVHVK
jgi:hypothetical protein